MATKKTNGSSRADRATNTRQNNGRQGSRLKNASRRGAGGKSGVRTTKLGTQSGKAGNQSSKLRSQVAKQGRKFTKSGARKKTTKRAMYMRRRIVLAIIVVVVGVFCVFSLVRGSVMIGQNMAAGDTSAKRSAVPAPRATSNVAVCGKDDIQLTLIPDTTTVGVGGTVTFTAKITYIGSNPEGCFVDGEDDNRILTITSGNETVWRSDACESKYRPLLLYQGATDEQKITWNTNATGNECVADEDLAHVKAGTYVAKLSLKDDESVHSEPVTITVQ